ncbi:DMT family transporter [Rhodobacteraceae bacterium N5(2021)]|uniref:DMT family transporter n=1 Tax=Gymnodinialimonas phycosphaerae TaxID=2841589 RepID=A0A975TYK9_9RHOB|nr:DMT family transporter [Gymnodinialimonas phycosphaerae]MBY4893148.1 DMT family transporter [Gymnodinialimonas phycosphaerae]
MRFVFLICVVLVAFASNSILNRMAVGGGEIDAIVFALVRAFAGAVTLAVLVLIQRRGLPVLAPARIVGAGSLTVYLIGFSISYIQMDAGLGALILFGGVQVTMFAGALIGGERPPARRWIGAALALAGLAWLSWPSGAAALPAVAVIAMLAAAVGWGIYSLAGRRATYPMAETGANFIWSVPPLLLLTLLRPVQIDGVATTVTGIVLAVVAGGLTSGLGYALWYDVLPKLRGSTSALLQLTVPVIAMAAGVALLGEVITWRMVGAGAVTLGGIAYGLGLFQRRTGSSTS